MPALSRARTRPLVTGLACLIAAAAALAGCSKDDGPKGALDAFLAGWPTGKLDNVGFVAPTGDKLPASQVAAEIRALSGELRDIPPDLRIDGDPKITKNLATARVKVDWKLPAGNHWTFPTTVRLKKFADDWAVIWEPAIINTGLEVGDELAVRRVPATRASILDGAGQPIFEPRPVVVVGVQPNQVADMTDLVRQLDKAFRSLPIPAVYLSDLPARVRAASPTAFVDVAALREPAYNQIRRRIHDLAGTVFRRETWDLPPTREFARALLGTVDDATKEDLDKNPGTYRAGDKVGHGGLQERYDERLRGVPGERVVIERKAADGTVTEIEVFTAEPKAGTPVKSTLDDRVQRAADAALAPETRNAAVVAVRVSDGAVLAVANGPRGGTQNLAFTAQVPPGSTFKMVSALGLLDNGAVTLNDVVACPKNLTVGGQTFKNSHDFALGSVKFREDFAKSCNTAFASLAPKLGPDGLAQAGASLGLGAAWDLGVDAFTGKVSSGGAAAEQAMAAFGQGATQVSPLAMAAAAAAVAHGQWQQPHVLVDPAPRSPAQPGPRLKAGSVDPLKTMMREVVTYGTGKALADVPGQPVYGKTGTAEYDGNPAHTHAWFVGWQGDLAFAVFIQNGGDSTTSSVPLAERFLRRLS
jgi:cell division protein FtsI/penicillin-binding protein 2